MAGRFVAVMTVLIGLSPNPASTQGGIHGSSNTRTHGLSALEVGLGTEFLLGLP